MGRKQRGKPERLRRLDTPKIIAGDRRVVMAGTASQTVDNRHPRDRAVVARIVERGKQGVDDRSGNKRAGRIMDHDDAGWIGGKCFEAGARRRLAGRTAQNRIADRQPGDCSIVAGPVVWVYHDAHRRDCRVGKQPHDGMAQQRHTGDELILLGQVTTGTDAATGRNDKGGDVHADALPRGRLAEQGETQYARRVFQAPS